MIKSEIIQRFNMLNDMVTKKFAERPTFDLFTRNKKDTGLKIEALNERINHSVD